MSTRIVCSECINKQEEIYRLREEVKTLKTKLRIQERKITEGYFGSSTPSSKKPVKNNSAKNSEEKNRGGAKVGHKGNGRRSVSIERADRVYELKVGCRYLPFSQESLRQRGKGCFWRRAITWRIGGRQI